jgi:hypothetical protein
MADCHGEAGVGSDDSPRGLLHRVNHAELAALADLVADRVVSRLASALATRHAGPGPPRTIADRHRPSETATRLLTAGEVAKRFAVSSEWVRENADRLGALRLGDGARPRLRFDGDIVASALTRRSGSARSEHGEAPADPGDRSRSEGDATGNGLDSLPVRELEPRPFPRNRPGAAATARGTATRTRPSPRAQPNPPRDGSAAAGRGSPHRHEREESA